MVDRGIQTASQLFLPNTSDIGTEYTDTFIDVTSSAIEEFIEAIGQIKIVRADVSINKPDGALTYDIDLIPTLIYEG